jgi:hypothetical protein
MLLVVSAGRYLPASRQERVPTLTVGKVRHSATLGDNGLEINLKPGQLRAASGQANRGPRLAGEEARRQSVSVPLQRNLRLHDHSSAPSRSRTWLGRAARAGYFTSGVIYFVFAGLALSAILGRGNGMPRGRGDAILEIAHQPFGQALLILTATGLAGFALWRAVQAIFNPERRKGKGGFEGATRRIGEALGALMYGALAVLAVQVLQGDRTNPEQHRTWVARLLSESYGAPVLAAIGTIIIFVGGVQIYRAVTVKFGELLCWHQMGPKERKLAVWSGRIGLCARAVAFFLIGYFIVRAALTHDPSRAKDVGEALAQLNALPYAAVAIGFAAFGVYQLVLSRYRRIEPAM